MNMNQRKAIVTDEHRKEAADLKAIWKISPRPSQAAWPYFFVCHLRKTALFRINNYNYLIF